MKRKGFTLVELLGVIVLLGLIALIVYPTVGGMLNKSKEGTLTNTGRGIIKTFKQLYVPYVGKEMQYNFNTEEFIIAGNVTDEKFHTKGELPEGGYIMANSDGKIAMYVYKDGYCIYKATTDRDVLLRKIGNDPSLCTE